MLVIIDGAKALHKAVSRGLRLPRIDPALPRAQAAQYQAYVARDARRARRRFENLAHQLEHQYPGPAAALREGPEETLTVIRLELPEHLERILSSTKLIENLFSRVREGGRRVKRRQGGTMALRGARPVYSRPSAASSCSPAIVRCALTMPNSIELKENLTRHRMPLN